MPGVGTFGLASPYTMIFSSCIMEGQRLPSTRRRNADSLYVNLYIAAKLLRSHYSGLCGSQSLSTRAARTDVGLFG